MSKVMINGVIHEASTWRGIRFTEADVINRDDWIPEGEFNPHRVRPWLLHDHGFTLAVVFAVCLQDALDIAADDGRLDTFKLDWNDETHRADHAEIRETGNVRPDGTPEVALDWKEHVTFLGNHGDPFDIETLEYVKLPNPRASFCSQFNASYPENAG